MIFLFLGVAHFRNEMIWVWKENFIQKFWDLNIFHIKNFVEFDKNFYMQNFLWWGLFAQKKLFIIDELDFSLSKDKEGNSMEYFIEILDKIPEEVILIFNNEKVDKRSKIYKKIKKIWEIKDFSIEDEPALKQKLSKIYDWKLAHGVLEKIIAKKWINFSSIKNELDKLLIFKDFVELSDLKYISQDVEESIFNIINNLLNLNTKKAVIALQELSFFLWNNYLLYNSLLSNLRVYFYIFYLKKLGYTGVGITQTLNLGRRSFLASKNYKISFEQFCKMYENLVQIDSKMKSWKLLWNEDSDLFFEIEKSILFSNK